MDKVKAQAPPTSDAMSVKDGTYTDIAAASSLDETTDISAMTAEEIAAFEIDPVIEAEVRWAYDKVILLVHPLFLTILTSSQRILPAAFCMYFFSALVCACFKYFNLLPTYTRRRTEAISVMPKPTAMIKT